MSNATKLVAALSVAGTMLASAPASVAQEQLTRAYVSGVYANADCYYNISQICGPANGAYAAIAAPLAVDAYAAVNGFVQRPYLATTPWLPRGLRGSDWVAIHGANF
jgi:hypothetical protein